jgi:hypothetical protein
MAKHVIIRRTDTGLDYDVARDDAQRDRIIARYKRERVPYIAVEHNDGQQWVAQCEFADESE